jgi:hypothetical protein
VINSRQRKRKVENNICIVMFIRMDGIVSCDDFALVASL